MTENEEINRMIGSQLMELIPYNVAIIDKELNIVKANKSFEKYFGEWSKKKCYQAYKKVDEKCRHCNVDHVFALGETIISNEAGFDKNGKICHYVVHRAPLKDELGNTKYLVEMSTDVTETSRVQHEYNLLFDNVPSYVSIIDKNYKIVKANKKLRDTFGEIHGKHCYEVYKKRKKRCRHCPAAMTFRDGIEHTSSETGITFSGDETQYVVNTTPLSNNENGVQLVIEIATDITEINELQFRLKRTHDFYVSLIENAGLGIIALDEKNKTVIINDYSKKLLSWSSFKKPVLSQLKAMLPEKIFDEKDYHKLITEEIESKILDTTGAEISVRYSAIRLFSNNKYIGKVIFLQDIRQMKEMEKSMLEAERLSAVGQTVAGLAHTIKNLLMGLEGGMYIVDSGLRKGDAARIVEGWDILQRNFTKTTDLVKGFLSFSKGRQPELKPVNPNKLVEDIIELYHDTAKNQNVELSSVLSPKMYKIHLDPDGIEACLTNLLSNAIDAASSREDKKGIVEIKTGIKDGYLIFEVTDNGCGIDSEIMKNIFTNFFTTKGNKGTGLGLLTTNKIIKEHGGFIDVSSQPGIGSTFKITLSINRLNSIYINNLK